MRFSLNIDSPTTRSRPVYCGLTAFVILLGLASRRFQWLLPQILKKNAGDILWATMVFLLVCILFPRLSTLRVAAISAAFSLCIEFFKFYHAPGLDTFRATTIGRLIFGYQFSWSNIACYILGICIVMFFEAIRQKRSPTDQSSH